MDPAIAIGASGNEEEAGKIVQGALFQSIALGLNHLAQLGTFWADDPWFKRIVKNLQEVVR